MFVRISFLEDGDGFSSFGGEVAEDDFERIVGGTFPQPFLKLENTFWIHTKKGKESWEEDKEELRRLGVGSYSNYIGSKYIRIDRIMIITPIKAIALDDGST